MSELFSDIRVIDYFFTVDIEINNDNLIQFASQKEKNYLNLKSKRIINKVYPKFFNDENIDFNSFILFFNSEKAYLNNQKNEYSIFMFKKNTEKINYLYLYSLKVYIKLNLGNKLNVYIPKYICLISSQYFQKQFKNLLEEIYINSTKNNVKCFKVENILNIILFRLYLPKDNTIQLNFCLEKSYNFTNNFISKDLNYEIIFKHISIVNFLIIYFGVLLNSIIVFIYKDIEFLSMIYRSLYQLLFPFEFNCLTISNLPYEYRNIFNFDEGVLIGINKFEYGNNLKDIFSEFNNENTLFFDVEENIIINNYHNIIYENKATPQSYFHKMEKELNEILNENNQNKNYYIQKVFFGFVLEIFFYFNPLQHLKEEKFDINLFIKDSLYEIRPLLFYMKKISYFQNFILGLENHFNKKQNEKKENIEIFLKGLSLKKNGEDFLNLFTSNIYHSILISSPPYEKLSYIQTNIFNDKIHETMFKHKKPIELYKFSLNKILEKNFLNSNKVMNLKKLIQKIKDILNGNYNKFMEFYGIQTNQNCISNNSELKMSIISNNNNNNIINLNLNINPKIKELKLPCSKNDYITFFDEMIKYINFKGEFHFVFGLNVISISCFCPYCKKINNIFDIRKEFEFFKAKRESRTKCKFCEKLYVPYFEIIEDKKKIKGNVTKKKIDYYCFEHLIDVINEKDINKKDNINTIYNINLLFNEIKCLIEGEQIYLKNIQSFINEQQIQFEDYNLFKKTNKNPILSNNKNPFIKLIKKETNNEK